MVEVLAQVDRSPGQDTSKGNWHGTRRHYVTRGTDPRKINSRLLAGYVATATGNGRIADACRDGQRMIDGDEAWRPIIAEDHAGASMAPAREISIYFPLVLDRSAFYRELDFASATHWADLLDACVGNGRTPEAR